MRLLRVAIVLLARRACACSDSDERCAAWERAGECEENPGYMLAACARSCGSCLAPLPPPPEEQDDGAASDRGGGVPSPLPQYWATGG